MGVDINDAATRIDNLYLEVREEAAYQENLKQDILTLRQEIETKEDELRVQYAEELATAQSAADTASAAYDEAVAQKAVTEAAVQALVGESGITELLPDMADDFASQAGIIALSTESEEKANAALELIENARSVTELMAKETNNELTTFANKHANLIAKQAELKVQIEDIEEQIQMSNDDTEKQLLQDGLNTLRDEKASVIQEIEKFDWSRYASLNEKPAIQLLVLELLTKLENTIKNDITSRIELNQKRATHAQFLNSLKDVELRRSHMELQLYDYSFIDLGQPVDVTVGPLGIHSEAENVKSSGELELAVNKAKNDVEKLSVKLTGLWGSFYNNINVNNNEIVSDFINATDSFYPFVYVYDESAYGGLRTLFESNEFVYGYSEFFEEYIYSKLGPEIDRVTLKTQQEELSEQLFNLHNLGENREALDKAKALLKQYLTTLNKIESTLLSAPDNILTFEQASSLWNSKNPEGNAEYSAYDAYQETLHQANYSASSFLNKVYESASKLDALVSNLEEIESAYIEQEAARTLLEASEYLYITKLTPLAAMEKIESINTTNQNSVTNSLEVLFQYFESETRADHSTIFSAFYPKNYQFWRYQLSDEPLSIIFDGEGDFSDLYFSTLNDLISLDEIKGFSTWDWDENFEFALDYWQESNPRVFKVLIDSYRQSTRDYEPGTEDVILSFYNEYKAMTEHVSFLENLKRSLEKVPSRLLSIEDAEVLWNEKFSSNNNEEQPAYTALEAYESALEVSVARGKRQIEYIDEAILTINQFTERFQEIERSATALNESMRLRDGIREILENEGNEQSLAQDLENEFRRVSSELQLVTEKISLQEGLLELDPLNNDAVSLLFTLTEKQNTLISEQAEIMSRLEEESTARDILVNVSINNLDDANYHKVEAERSILENRGKVDEIKGEIANLSQVISDQIEELVIKRDEYNKAKNILLEKSLIVESNKLLTNENSEYLSVKTENLLSLEERGKTLKINKENYLSDQAKSRDIIFTQTNEINGYQNLISVNEKILSQTSLDQEGVIEEIADLESKLLKAKERREKAKLMLNSYGLGEGVVDTSFVRNGIISSVNQAMFMEPKFDQRIAYISYSYRWGVFNQYTETVTLHLDLEQFSYDFRKELVSYLYFNGGNNIPPYMTYDENNIAKTLDSIESSDGVTDVDVVRSRIKKHKSLLEKVQKRAESLYLPYKYEDEDYKEFLDVSGGIRYYFEVAKNQVIGFALNALEKIKTREGQYESYVSAVEDVAEIEELLSQHKAYDNAYDKINYAETEKEKAYLAIESANVAISEAHKALNAVEKDIAESESHLITARSERYDAELALSITRGLLLEAELDKANAEKLLLAARKELNVAAFNYNEAQSSLLLATNSLNSAYTSLSIAVELHRQAEMYIRQAEASEVESKKALLEAQNLINLAEFTVLRKANADIASHDTSYEYDDRGQLKTELSALVSFGEHTDTGVQQYIGRLATEHTYDSLGNVRTTTTAANTNQASTKEFEYDVQGNQTRAVGLGGGSVIYNNQNLAAVNINALGHRRDRVYDDEGRLRYEVDELGFVTKHRYDGLNQKTTQLRYANAYTASRPEGEPLTLAALDAFISEGEGGDFRALDYRYSTRGELETTTTSSSVDSQTRTNGVHHNAFGDKTSTFTTYVDEQGESLTVTNQQHLYNAAGQLMASRDAEGYVTVYAYNGYGELSSQREIKARYVDSSGNPLVWDWTSVKAWAETQQGAARERRTDFAYDARGNRQQVTQVDVEYAQHGGTTVEQVRGDLITTTYHDHAGRQFMTVQEAAPSDPASHLVAENRTLQEYDALGRLVASWSKRKDYVVSGIALSVDNEEPSRLSKHQRTDYTYDAQGNLMATESDGRTTYQYYDADGKLTRRVDAEGNVTHVEMDAMNRTQAEWRHVSAPGYQFQQRTEYNYDATGRQTGTTVVVNGGDNIREEARYNAFGEVEAKTHNGVVQEAYAYDGLGRVHTKTLYGSQHNVITNYQYNWLDKVTVETLGGTRTTTRAYDLKGNLTGEKGPWFDGKQSVTTQTFDRWGNVLKQTMNGNTYDFVYNHANQVILQTSPLEDKTIVDANGQTDDDARPQTRMFYDRHGNRIAVQDANGHWQWSKYDLTGQKLWDKNGEGGITRYYHNIHGEMVGRIADGQGEVYRYNNNGQLLTRSKIDNTQGYLEVYAQYAYDQAGQRYHEQWFGGAGYEIYTQFDAAGRVRETKGAGQHKRYTYDSFGNKEAEIWLDGGAEQARKTSAYDAFGKLTTETLYDGSEVTHHYDKYGQLDNELDKKTGAINIDYDYWENGLLKSQTAGTKTESYQYNADGKETRRALSDGATALVTHTEWDNLGRIERIRNEAVSAFGQSLNASTVTYRYDAVGNRRKITTTGEQSSTRWYHYDKDHRMVGSHTSENDLEAIVGRQDGDRIIKYNDRGQKLSEIRWATQSNNDVSTINRIEDIFGYDQHGHLNRIETYEKSRFGKDKTRLVTIRNSRMGQALSQTETSYLYDYLDGVLHSRIGSKTTETDLGYLDGQMVWQGISEDGKSSVSQRFDYHYTGQIYQQTTVFHLGDKGVDTLTYAYSPKDLQKATITAESTRSGNGSGFKAGTTTHHYNNTGQLTGITSTRDESERKHLTDFNGQIALQLDVDKNTLLANLTTSGNPLAVITKGKVDADLLDDSGSSAGQQPGTYTVGANDTLQRIAQLVYGDSRYWYLIADANGISPTEPLTEGKLLVIPNQHTQTFNGAESFKPYNESEVLGNVNPDPIALPPPKKSCNPIAMIVMVVVAVVVTIYTAGAAATLFAGGSLTAGGVGAAGVGALGGVAAGGAVVTTAGVTTSLGALGLAGAAAIGGAVGSAASQLVGKGLGVVDDFSWEQVALGGLTAAAASGIGGALGEYGVFNANPDAANLAWRQAGNAAVSSATSYGGNYLGSKLLGEDVSFSWTNLAASAVGSVVSVGSAQLTKGLNVVGDTIDNFVSSATASALRGESFRRNAGNMLTDAFGNALATAATSGAREAYDVERSAAFEREKLRNSIDENTIRLLKTVDFKQREEQPGGILLANVNTPKAPKGVVPSPARVQADALLYFAEQQIDVWDVDEEFAANYVATTSYFGYETGYGAFGGADAPLYPDGATVSQEEMDMWGGVLFASMSAISAKGLGKLKVNLDGDYSYHSAYSLDKIDNVVSNKVDFEEFGSVSVSGKRPIDLAKSYESGIRDLYGDVPLSQRVYFAPHNKSGVGYADNVASINGRQVAIEAKYTDDWANSIFNPESSKGQLPWAATERARMINQAKNYNSTFDDIIYHTNSTELATHYSQLLKDNGITNFKFVITPATK
ncbi:hypothetical protein [Grimontia sp. AD028]|uniref:hypothetical protein n=1 Tax=Grimontia sp. AD028 TaxID=1581149 RepID=UPI001E2E52F6|nr:hypothetical protein [Grimontia sp. AD028]